jgi:hypothetical protein
LTNIDKTFQEASLAVWVVLGYAASCYSKDRSKMPLLDRQEIDGVKIQAGAVIERARSTLIVNRPYPTPRHCQGRPAISSLAGDTARPPPQISLTAILPLDYFGLTLVSRV